MLFRSQKKLGYFSNRGFTSSGPVFEPQCARIILAEGLADMRSSICSPVSLSYSVWKVMTPLCLFERANRAFIAGELISALCRIFAFFLLVDVLRKSSPMPMIRPSSKSFFNKEKIFLNLGFSALFCAETSWLVT